MHTQISTLQKHHLAQRVPNKQTVMRKELRTIREHLREAEQDMKEHKWQSVAELLNEIATMATELRIQAEANDAVTAWLHEEQ